MSNLKYQLKKQIIEELNLEEIKPEDIQDDAPLFVEGLKLDSIDALELVVLLENYYGVSIPDEVREVTIETGSLSVEAATRAVKVDAFMP